MLPGGLPHQPPRHETGRVRPGNSPGKPLGGPGANQSPVRKRLHLAEKALGHGRRNPIFLTLQPSAGVCFTSTTHVDPEATTGHTWHRSRRWTHSTPARTSPAGDIGCSSQGETSLQSTEQVVTGYCRGCLPPRCQPRCKKTEPQSVVAGSSLSSLGRAHAPQEPVSFVTIP